VLFTYLFIVLKVFMLSPLKGGSGLKAKSTHPDFSGQSLGALCHKPTTHQKIPKVRDCLWGKVHHESIPHMIPKPNARLCFLIETASVF
jgi:hypothetical protein